MRKTLFIKLVFAAILIAVLCIIFEIREVHTGIINAEKESMAKFNAQVFVRFLDILSTEISQPDCIIDQEIQNKIVKRIVEQRGKYDSSNLPNLRYPFIDQINFLMSIKDELSSNKCTKIVDLMSQEITSLRMCLDAQLGDISGADFNFSRETVFSLFYVPANLVRLFQGEPFNEVPETEQTDVMETIWPNGCRAISYSINEAFPVEKFILDVSSFYTNANFVPLDYDLCMPRSLASLKGGWQKVKGGGYWIQFWENNNDVINVKIVTSENRNASIISIKFIKSTQAVPMLEVAKKRLSHGPNFFQPIILGEK